MMHGQKNIKLLYNCFDHLKQIHNLTFHYLMAFVLLHGVPLATERGISLIILTPMKILNRSTLVMWEMKRNVFVVRLISLQYPH